MHLSSDLGVIKTTKVYDLTFYNFAQLAAVQIA